jgi:glycosyltransferase involved in cell wall biosynthesis
MYHTHYLFFTMHTTTEHIPKKPLFSIIIPTFNNINYLMLCINSIKKNSTYQHEIILHVNDGTDGTLAYAIKEHIKHTHSAQNIGLCSAINSAADLATTNYILYCHDDMYLCPGWDACLYNEVTQLNSDAFYLSGTTMGKPGEPITLDCGTDYKNFDEEKLLKQFDQSDHYDYQGSQSAPHLVHIKYWKKVGGFSPAFNPGKGSDPDFNMKLWQAGVRIFKGLQHCRAYHFASRTLYTSVKPNNCHSKFLIKWGISIFFFQTHYLRRNEVYRKPLSKPKHTARYITHLALLKIKLAIYKSAFRKRKHQMTCHTQSEKL